MLMVYRDSNIVLSGSHERDECLAACNTRGTGEDPRVSFFTGETGIDYKKTKKNATPEEVN